MSVRVLLVSSTSGIVFDPSTGVRLTDYGEGRPSAVFQVPAARREPPSTELKTVLIAVQPSEPPESIEQTFSDAAAFESITYWLAAEHQNRLDHHLYLITDTILHAASMLVYKAIKIFFLIIY